MSGDNTAIQPRAWWVPALVDFISGTAGGFAGKMIEYPFDTLKVRVQTQSTASTSTAGRSGATMQKPGQVLMTTLRTEGAMALYRGLTLPLLGTMVETACLFAANGAIKDLLTHGSDRELSLLEVVVAGAGTGIAVSPVLAPIELVKCRLQIQKAGTRGAYTGVLDCIRHAVRTEGPLVMFRGLGATVAREVPGTAAWFGMYELFMRALMPAGADRSTASASTTIAAGALGGIGYWGLCYPADTVKSYIQTSSSQGQKSFMSVLQHLIRTRGIQGLYAGLSPTLLRAAPANASVFYCYETVSRALQEFTEEEE